MNLDRQNARGISRRSFLAGGGLAAAGLVLGEALVREPRSFRVEELVLPTTGLPAGKELRLVQLSDLHIRTFHNFFKDVARAVNALAPQVILLTGDYLEEDRNIRGVRRFLKMLKAPHGIFAVQGNWEYWSRLEGENLRRHFARCGATLLINQRHDPDLKDAPLTLLGLDYPSGSDHLQELVRQAEPQRVNLLLSHVPAFEHRHLHRHIDLVLCGHTHGGQVRLPFLPPFYLPRYSGDFVAGLYGAGPHDTPLYVNRGIGTSVLPARLLCPPEITLLRLVGRRQG